MRRAFTVVALLFFFTPVGLRVVGVHAHPFENRRLADAPRLSQGWSVFDQATRFFVDRMPLREQAVRANSWIALHVFDTTPSTGTGHGEIAGAPGFANGAPVAPQGSATPAPAAAGAPAAPAATPSPQSQVVVGKDGWLYLQGELNRPCEDFIDRHEAMRRWKRLVAIVRASGRKAVLVIPPDKVSIYPQHLPDSYPSQECQGLQRHVEWDVYERPDPRVVTLRRALTERARRAKEPLYRRKDSHWSTVGAMELVRRVLPRVSRTVRVREDEVHRLGAKPYTGDLANLLGTAEADRAPAVEVRRAADAPRLPGTTLLVHDSYGLAVEGLLAPYAETFKAFDWVGSTPQTLIDAIRGADNVVFETVEREVDFRASDQGPVTPGVLDALETALR